MHIRVLGHFQYIWAISCIIHDRNVRLMMTHPFLPPLHDAQSHQLFEDERRPQDSIHLLAKRHKPVLCLIATRTKVP
jgi:hypothetical protein